MVYTVVYVWNREQNVKISKRNDSLYNLCVCEHDSCIENTVTTVRVITTQGSVKIQSPQVIFTAKEVYLNSGFEVYPGSSLILDTNNFNCQ